MKDTLDKALDLMEVSIPTRGQIMNGDKTIQELRKLDEHMVKLSARLEDLAIDARRAGAAAYWRAYELEHPDLDLWERGRKERE